MTLPWRTNIGLRLTEEEGEWFKRKCKTDNRNMCNLVRHLIVKEMEKEENGVDTK